MFNIMASLLITQDTKDIVQDFDKVKKQQKYASN